VNGGKEPPGGRNQYLYEHACGPPDEDCQLDPPYGMAVTNAVRRSAQKECRREKIGVRELKGCGEVEVWNITN